MNLKYTELGSGISQFFHSGFGSDWIFSQFPHHRDGLIKAEYNYIGDVQFFWRTEQKQFP